MKHVVLAIGIAGVATVAPAAANEELAKKHACFACHTLDRKMVGPSYREVAAKYRADKDAPKKLAQKVKNGSQGAWGETPMPPNTAVPDADVTALVKWILAQR